MKNPRMLALLLWAAIFESAFAVGGTVRIIANPSVKAETISAREIKSVFMEEGASLRDGTHVEPVLSKGGPAHTIFLEKFLEISDADLQTYYRALVFTGRGSIPRVLGSDGEVVSYVARTRGAIGYVDSDSAAEGVKTLAVGDGWTPVERKLLIRVEAEYPETLKQMNIGGTVRLRLSVSAKGTVQDVQLEGGNPILAEAAMTAVRKWVYAPAKMKTNCEVTVTFENH